MGSIDLEAIKTRLAQGYKVKYDLTPEHALADVEALLDEVKRMENLGVLLDPCTDLNQAMLVVNTKTHKLLLESPQDGEDSWMATLVRHDSPRTILSTVWAGHPAQAIVEVYLKEAGEEIK